MTQSSTFDFRAILGRTMFDQVPFAVSIMDAKSNIVAANANFGEFFGDWRGRKCYEVFKHENKPCEHCEAHVSFHDGLVHVVDEAGIDRHGRACHYAVYLTPLKDLEGGTQYVMAMASDLTETRRWQRDYELLFGKMPCFAFVIDRDFRIVRSNEKFRRSFGEPGGNFCYSVCKRRKSACAECPAARTFEDGEEHAADQVGIHKDGSPSYYVSTSTPLSRGKHGVSEVLQMAVDITDTFELESQLRETRDFYQRLMRGAPAGILVVDTRGNTKMLNAAARKLLDWKPRQLPGAEWLKRMLPGEFFSAEAAQTELLQLEDTTISTAQHRQVPVRLSAIHLRSGHKELGRAAFITDQTSLKRLEQEKLDGERMAAVGQTVAGLAHTIKNLLMGLEGGMYMVDTGLRRGDAARIQNGWGMLHRNFEKTTTLVKDFLAFAKGRTPQLDDVDPAGLARDVVALYKDAAALQDVQLAFAASPAVAAAPLDREGVETCLTNLVSNAIDAAAMREDRGGKVVVRTLDDHDDLVFEVADNGCGMDWEVKGKVFTTFFTTKGTKGTGLGLLTTRKIVQEHGGRVEVDSTAGQGTTFRIRLPRARLRTIAESSVQDTTVQVQS